MVSASLSSSERDLLLSLHRKTREAVGASNMKYLEWSSTLASKAQNYAEECHGLVHSGDGGENLGTATYDDVGRLYKLWEDERDMFEASDSYRKSFPGGHGFGHYTQIVWASNTKVGCGKAYCDNLSQPYNLVCRYEIGNIISYTVYSFSSTGETDPTFSKKTTTTKKATSSKVRTTSRTTTTKKSSSSVSVSEKETNKVDDSKKENPTQPEANKINNTGNVNGNVNGNGNGNNKDNTNVNGNNNNIEGKDGDSNNNDNVNKENKGGDEEASVGTGVDMVAEDDGNGGVIFAVVGSAASGAFILLYIKRKKPEIYDKLRRQISIQQREIGRLTRKLTTKVSHSQITRKLTKSLRRTKSTAAYTSHRFKAGAGGIVKRSKSSNDIKISLDEMDDPAYRFNPSTSLYNTDDSSLPTTTIHNQRSMSFTSSNGSINSHHPTSPMDSISEAHTAYTGLTLSGRKNEPRRKSQSGGNGHSTKARLSERINSMINKRHSYRKLSLGNTSSLFGKSRNNHDHTNTTTTNYSGPSDGHSVDMIEKMNNLEKYEEFIQSQSDSGNENYENSLSNQTSYNNNNNNNNDNDNHSLNEFTRKTDESISTAMEWIHDSGSKERKSTNEEITTTTTTTVAAAASASKPFIINPKVPPPPPIRHATGLIRPQTPQTPTLPSHSFTEKSESSSSSSSPNFPKRNYSLSRKSSMSKGSTPTPTPTTTTITTPNLPYTRSQRPALKPSSSFTSSTTTTPSSSLFTKDHHRSRSLASITSSRPTPFTPSASRKELYANENNEGNQYRFKQQYQQQQQQQHFSKENGQSPYQQRPTVEYFQKKERRASSLERRRSDNDVQDLSTSNILDDYFDSY